MNIKYLCYSLEPIIPDLSMLQPNNRNCRFLPVAYRDIHHFIRHDRKCGLRIADSDCGLRTRIAESDCGLRMADYGLRIADCAKIRVRRAQLYFD